MTNSDRIARLAKDWDQAWSKATTLQAEAQYNCSGFGRQVREFGGPAVVQDGPCPQQLPVPLDATVREVDEGYAELLEQWCDECKIEREKRIKAKALKRLASQKLASLRRAIRRGRTP